MYTEDKNGKREEYTCDGDTPISIPLVVLVNENTASAAEIFTGAVKDYGIGTIVGTTTFGKGIVQNTFQLSDGSVVKLTIAHYYTPLGNDIHKVGITPDVEVELPDDATSDVQLEKALEVVKGLESADKNNEFSQKSRKKVGKKARTCYLSRGAENRSWQALKESEERQMNFTERRKQVFDKMDQDSALLLFSGIELHVSADEYLPFEANRNFFYLTGLRRDHMILMMKKTAKRRNPFCLSRKRI